MSSCCTCSIPNLRPPGHDFLFSLKSHCRAVQNFVLPPRGNPANSRDPALNRKRVKFRSATGVRIGTTVPRGSGLDPTQ